MREMEPKTIIRPMPLPKQTHYEILGVAKDAKLTDIGRAYNRLKSNLHRDDAVPDPKRAAVLKAAYDTLSDETRRAEYDLSLKKTGRQRKAKGSAAWIGAIAVGTAAIVAGYFHFKPPPEAPPGAKGTDQIAAAATMAVGSIQSVDISGNTTPQGLAFVIAERVMVSSCHRVPPGAQLTVTFSPRTYPARITDVDNTGICRLTVDSVGARPLPIGGTNTRAGDTVYETRLNAVGQAALIEGQVKRVVTGDEGRSIEATIPMSPERAGGPLLDAFGRVVAVATFAEAGKGRHFAIPPAWIREIEGPREMPKAREPPPQEEPKTPEELEQAAARARMPKNVSPERVEKLEKAFRPPPTVPKDL